MNFLKRKDKNITILNENNDIIYAPITGKVIALEEVNDPVFSTKMMGDGIAILPSAKELYSPVSGRVCVVFPTKHAIGIEANNGAKIIAHIGIETVNLDGKGFDVKIQQGDYVKAGQLLAKLDLSFIAEKYDTTTMIVIENSKEYKVVKTTEKEIKAGYMLMKLEKV